MSFQTSLHRCITPFYGFTQHSTAPARHRTGNLQYGVLLERWTIGWGVNWVMCHGFVHLGACINPIRW